jgi:glycine/D-amino acid oxidase-like deaminating enzyme
MPLTEGGVRGIDSIASFIDECLPALAGSQITDVTDVDQCDYDLVDDDDFVLGSVPGFSNVFVGVGWRGTGYKFSPWVGRVLFELACREGTVYDISRFDPVRFDLALTTVTYSEPIAAKEESR